MSDGNHRNYNQYERISDTILYLNKTWRVTFNVNLAYKDKDGNRKFYYQEYGYTQNKYNGSNYVISIKRNFDSYIIIEDTTEKNNNIMIRKSDMLALRHCLKIGVKWLTDNSLNIFALNDEKKLYLANNDSCMCCVGEDRAIKFEPMIIPGFNENDVPGIRMYINDERNYTEITSKAFLDFYESMSNFNFQIAAYSALGSVPFVPDDVAVNRMDMETRMIGIMEEEKERKKKKSFFDKKGENE